VDPSRTHATWKDWNNDSILRFRPAFLIVHIGGNDLDRRENSTELCFKTCGDFILSETEIQHYERNRSKIYPSPFVLRSTPCEPIVETSHCRRQHPVQEIEWLYQQGRRTSFFLMHGVHLNDVGLDKYFREIRGILLLQLYDVWRFWLCAVPELVTLSI
jgi:hypothetical protein